MEDAKKRPANAGDVEPRVPLDAMGDRTLDSSSLDHLAFIHRRTMGECPSMVDFSVAKDCGRNEAREGIKMKPAYAGFEVLNCQ